MADHTTVSFRNSYGKTISVAYKFMDYGCRDDCGEEWNVRGWVVLQPGEVTSRPNPTGNRWFWYFAEAVDGATWTGEEYAEVKGEVFSKCTCLGVSAGGSNPYHYVGMVTIDLWAQSGVNFIP